jgi:1,4-alpha-glucan branching enzyme
MVTAACAMWLGEYRVDGLRFDSANDLPGHSVQVRKGKGRMIS